MKKSAVVIGGGSGISFLVPVLTRQFTDVSAIVSVADSGGPNGVLKREFRIVPPSDIRKVLTASAQDTYLKDLFEYRFQEPASLADYTIGNLIITSLIKKHGVMKGIREAERLLRTEAHVLPASLSPSELFAELEDGTVLEEESAIDVPTGDRAKIRRVWLDPEVTINPDAKGAIENADTIFIGPGDLYTSIIPNFLVEGMSETLRSSRGEVVFVINAETKTGETDGFRASEFVRVAEKYIGTDIIDVVIVPEPESGLSSVETDRENLGDLSVVSAQVLERGDRLVYDPERFPL